jgi:DNA-binding transcriptional LysR family regulator
MEFKQLRSFVEVIHRGGFTQAAKTLHISQSAVSKQSRSWNRASARRCSTASARRCA